MNFASLDLNLLKVLDALLREGSTVRAGQRVGLSQPAVSSALGRLRHALGDPLFLREGNRLVPTDFATAIAPELAETLERMERFLSGPGFDPTTADTVFRLSGTDYFGVLLMPRLAERVSREAPGVQTILIDLVTEAYIDTIDKYGVDIALMPKVGDLPAGFHWRPFAWASFVFAARKDHPRLARAGVNPGETVPLDLFCDLSHVVMSPEGKTETLSDDVLARMGRARRTVMSMPYFAGIYLALEQSDLVALLPTKLAGHVAERHGLALYRPPIEVPPVLLAMVWKATATSNPAHRWLREVVFDELVWMNEGEPPLPRGVER
ncbi:LysR family transcriptional regulator [Alphaproteobacteria bacterium GH1-50]|uniref:LysR family transcriptional regulator n=1 Tax=Kangsaoukella pontilimi TaxID=2691042 RepID=A0A7C9MF79_9RHOB|nr:LysR family transcriptional regulator [Kangsaoukella pontilimi]MXQ09351.1 LysR family transcriptional regulator [Kangsaoukella pontilimi]